MPKVNLYVLEINKFDFKPEWNWLEELGSAPRHEGDVVEGMIVPQGKVWLFPSGSDFKRLQARIGEIGERKSFRVEI